MKDLIKRILSEETRKKITKELAHQEALKYRTRNEFKLNNNTVYRNALKNGWMDDITTHMTPVQLSWTFDKANELASKYNTKKDFKLGDRKAYDIAVHHGWLEQITQHMVPLGNKYNRKIYAFEFPDKSVYVGLTYSPENRKKQHLSDNDKSAVFKYKKESNLSPNFIILSKDFLNPKESQEEEKKTIEKYRTDGWKILNRVAAGSLGGKDRYYTYEMVNDVSKNYDTINQFKKENPKLYAAASRYNWLKDISKHLKSRIINWDKEDVLEISKKYIKLSDFIKNEPKAVDAARRNGWFDEATEHMFKKIYWNHDTVKQEALKYETRNEFAKNSQSAYGYAVKHKILDDITKHMVSGREKWSDEDLKNTFMKYDTLSDLLTNEPEVYHTALRRNLLSDLKLLMKSPYKNKRWNPNNIQNELTKYDSLNDFKRQNLNTFTVLKRKLGIDYLENYYNNK